MTPLVDLHLHTTASDGLSPVDHLVNEAAAAGLRVMAVTDHDTMAAVAQAATLCAARGMTLVPGIEITAIATARDIHILGYFLDPEHEQLARLLAQSRATRVDRVRAIAERLDALGAPIDVSPLLDEAVQQTGRSVGRPLVARALVAAGHAADTNDAFDRWLARGRPGFVPRSGAAPEEVIAVIHAAGGLASLAHPGIAGIDDCIPDLRAAGLDALEAYHSDHDASATERYLAMARHLDLLVTGGSDYHGDPAHGLAPGSVTLPMREWEQLSQWPRRSLR